MGKVKKIEESKKIKVKRQLFVKPVAVVKPYVPENAYKAPQNYVPQVVETRPLEESDEETYEDQLEIYDDIPEIDDEQVRILDGIMIRIDRHLNDGIMNRNERYFSLNGDLTTRRVVCFGCCLCKGEESEHNHCCATTVCPYIQDLFERCRGCCYCI
ncbi:uncharacterized protein LOC124818648 [Hydra vulgaris]|uniref:uncharacterized protein LOC124810473 n=1 Tax=Hydra vulgaris TaxID=6087 RepID=UPI001F5F5C06|nr:uncharacterized protein LOC124808435 [Hydra vulgaris]XP_047131378.1 uncharacterized protein LOC124810473 [Hydra vulgaris]XP_047131904.1 uncharacterized protein LOC124810964 [Hydra vulgaris]XP_047145629.1 uncharacterized protein LOC124818648 [Hydra vulgaris]